MAEALMAKNCSFYNPLDPNNGQKEIYIQLILSLALGFSAFLGFCFLRPRWKSLYAARKSHPNATLALPELPDTLFGWMPVLYNITQHQVLASAGLDAYVFLAFFKMCIKLFSVMFLITCVLLVPINKHFDWLPTPMHPNNPRPQSTLNLVNFGRGATGFGADIISATRNGGNDNKGRNPDTSYLWAYLIFTYIFTGLVIYFMISETRRIIKVRQDYLGSQSTITDRTFKLSGIPRELRSEDKIKELIEKLEIGKVESVTVVRNWKTLDELMDLRNRTLRRLEEAWAVHLGKSRFDGPTPGGCRDSEPQEGGQHNSYEGHRLLGHSHLTQHDIPRPTTRVWYGFMGWQNKKVDAIDFYEEKLRRLDDKIATARNKEYLPTAMAFVTMDSIPACQMAVQALLDPSPMQLLAKPAPAPTDVVWCNTYLPRSNRMFRSWIISIFIIFLTIFWVVPVVALAGLLDLCSISQVWPQLASFLSHHDVLKSLVQTGLPTLVVSLLNIAVPFLYDYLSNMQGMISQGDVELSLISKNFFFTFFNVFLTFTIAGTATKFWSTLQESLKDTTHLASQLATAVSKVAVFFTNYILLQGLGLIPFRLLEFGSVSLYPIMLIGSKTPRDYAELVQPPLFKYGFYLPSAILVYILCIVYSILPAGYMVLFVGVIYFITSYYTYKYQLLYAMNNPQHATGGAWPMICYRIMIGLGVFQLVMAGIIALKNQFYAAGLVVPLIPFTIWYSYYFGRTYHPLMKFIALRSIRRPSNSDVNITGEHSGFGSPGPFRIGSNTVNEDMEEGLKFMNPSLTIRLAKLWIENLPESNGNSNGASNGSTTGLAPDLVREGSAASSLSLGDTHIWRDNVDNV